jgi:hypothetical protein
MALSKKHVAKIKQMIIDGDKTQNQIADKFGVTRGTISAIQRDLIHTDVKWPKERKKKKAHGQRKPVPQHDPTDERVLELEADVAHLTEERNLARRQAKAGAKYQGLFKACVEVVGEAIVPLEPVPTIKRPKISGKVIEEDLVFHLSDGHHDQVITEEETGGLEEYNFPISCARAEYLIDTMIEYTQCHLANHRFKNLWVLANGDHTGGEIHKHEQRSYFKNQFKNSLAIGQLHARMFRDLAPFFENVNVIYTPGNHGRRTMKKDYYGAHENWDYLVAQVARMSCGDMPNVNFLIPNAFSVNIDINGIGFNVSHGDDIRGQMGIPFYGMVRRQSKLMGLTNVMGGTRIRYFCMGHHHVSASLADLDGEIIVNGAWPGTDQFAYNAFAGYREPSQLIHGVHPRYGVTWRLPIKLKHEGENRGPERYQIEI